MTGARSSGSGPTGSGEARHDWRDFDRPPVLRDTCMHLRHKLMLLDERHESAGLVDESSDTRVYWCKKTAEALGPDDRPVDPGSCDRCRACFVPAPGAARAERPGR